MDCESENNSNSAKEAFTLLHNLKNELIKPIT